MKRVVDFVRRHRPGVGWAFLLAAILLIGFVWKPSSAATSTLVPNGDVSTGWTVPAGSSTTCAGGTHCDHVDEGTTNDDADYVSTGSSGSGGEVEEFALSSPTDVDTATQVVVNARLRSITLGSTADTVGFALRVNGVLQSVTTVSMTTTITNYTATFNGTWSQSDVDSMQIYLIRNVVGGGQTASRDDNVAVYNVYGTLTYTQSSTTEQSAYRIYNKGAGTGDGTFAMSYDAGGGDDAYSVAKASDGGYVTVQETHNGTAFDSVLTKHNSVGAVEWTRSWGTGSTSSSTPQSVIKTSDDGFAVAGLTGFNSGDMFLLKYSSTGTLEWERIWGESLQAEIANDVVQTSDGGFAVTGQTGAYGGGSYDVFLTKYSSTGTLLWTRTWGGTQVDVGQSLVYTSDGGYAISGYYTDPSTSKTEALLLKYDSSGAYSWDTTWSGGSTFNSEGRDIVQTSDGGYAITGIYKDGTNPNHVLLLKYGSSGTLSWSQSWGGSSGAQAGNAVVQTSDGGYAVAGQTATLGAGGNDMFLTKWGSSGGAASWTRTFGTSGGEFGDDLLYDSDGGYVLSGTTGNDSLLIKYDSSGAIQNCSTANCKTSGDSNGNPTNNNRSPTTTKTSPTVTSSTPSSSTGTATYIETNRAPTPVDVGSPLAAANTDANVTIGTPFRIRMLVHVGTGSLTSGAFRLQYAPQGVDDGCDTAFIGEETSYNYVTSTTGTIRFYNDPFATNNQVVATNANDPTHSGHSIVAQTFVDSYDAAANVASSVASGSDGLWDFSLTDSGGSAGQIYCFRLVKSTGALLNTYTVIPQVTLNAAPTGPTLDQQLRGGQSVLDGVKSPLNF